MNVTRWKTTKMKPGTARIHRPWDAVVTVKTPASGSVMSATRRRCSPSTPAIMGATRAFTKYRYTGVSERSCGKGDDRLPRETHVLDARRSPIAGTVLTSNQLKTFRRKSDMPYKSRVTGKFKGTTDEIIQWAAYKHGMPSRSPAL